MKEIEKDDVPDASGGISEGCTPVPYVEPLFPGTDSPYFDPLGDRRSPNPWERYQIDASTN